MGDIYIAAHLRRCLRHSVFGHVLQYTPSTSVLDALHLHHAIKSPPLRYPSPLHITFIEVKNELVKMKDVFPMKVITHTVTHQEKSAGGHIESKMYPANFAGGRSRLDLLLPSFLPSREEKKKQNRIFCPLWGHAVGRMQYAPTTCRQEALFPINSREERIETKIQEQKNRPLGCRGVLHTPPIHPERDKTKKQDQKNRPLGCRAQKHTPHMDRVRIETKMQERRKQSIDSGAEWHTPFMRQGERDAVWRDTFLEQRARVAIWRDRRLEEKYSHARLKLSTFEENSKPYKSSLVALSEQLRDIFAA